MCILNFDLKSILNKTKKKLKSLKNRFFNMFACFKKKRKASDDNIYFMNPMYDPNFNSKYELKEVVVIPNNLPVIVEQPKRVNPFNESNCMDTNYKDTSYTDIDADNNIDNLFSDGSVSDYDHPIFNEPVYEERKESIYNLIPNSTEPIYENIDNFVTEIKKNQNLDKFVSKVERNENLKFREIVFKRIRERRHSYDKSLEDIPENNSFNYSTYTEDFETDSERQHDSYLESEISEHISPQSDEYFDNNFDKNSEYNFDENSIDNLEEQWNHKISQSEISIRSVDINEDNNDSSEDNWDVLSN